MEPGLPLSPAAEPMIAASKARSSPGVCQVSEVPRAHTVSFRGPGPGTRAVAASQSPSLTRSLPAAP
eukprot:768283-Hanusia_phi.AAC.1